MASTREAVRDTLRGALLDCINEGRGQVIRLCGQAGIGKTTFAAEASELAVELGCAVYSASSSALDEGAPYQTLAPMQNRDGATLFGELLASPAPARPQVVTGRYGPEVERFSITERLIEAVEGACQVPALITVEDLHWADAPSLDALGRIARTTLSHPLVLLLTLRDTPATPNLAALAAVLADLGATTIELPVLSPSEVRALAETLVGSKLPIDLQERVTSANGNPFLVHEYLDGLLQHVGRFEDDKSLSLEDQLRDAVGHTLNDLGDRPAALTRAAAIQGGRIDVVDLADQLDATVLDIGFALERVINAGLLIEAGEDLRFRHDLIRDAVYTQMPNVLRTVAHRQLADVLARRNAAPALVASHLLLGGGHDGDTVALLRSAAAQTAPIAPESTLAFLDRARELVDASTESWRVIERARLEALTAAGRLGEAETVAHRLLGGSMAIEGGELYARLAGLALISGDSAKSKEYIERAIENAATNADRAHFLGAAAVASATAGEFTEAWTLANEAIACGEAEGEFIGSSIGAALIARMSTYTNEIDEGLALGARAVALADRDPTGTAHAWVPALHYGMTALDVDRLAVAEEMVALGRGHAATHHMAWALPLYGTLQAACHLRRGELDQAAAEAETAVEQAQLMQSLHTITWAQSILALVHLEMSSVVEARWWLEQAMASWRTGNSPLGVDHLALAHTRVMAAEGDRVGAFEVLCEHWDRLADDGLAFCHPLLAVDLGLLALDLKSGERVASAVEAMVAAADANRVNAIRAGAEWLQAVRGNDATLARIAIDKMRRSERRFELACWLAAHPELADPGDPASALEEASRIFAVAGAPLRVANVRLALDRLGVAEQGEEHSWATLTPTELAITELLAQGCTNAEIAQQRQSSRRTVESHLSRVYRKLAIDGRVKLTVAAAEHFRARP